MLWRFFLVLLGLGSIFTGALCAVLLWVLLASPVQSPKHDTEIPGSRVDAGGGGSIAPGVPPAAAAAAQPEFGREAAAPVGVGTASHPSSADVEPEKTAKETEAAPGAGADQPQLARTGTPDRRPPPEVAGTSTELHITGQCNLDACAARYKSFHRADCTYAPYGGGPRRTCELSSSGSEPPPLPAADAASEAKDTRTAARAAVVAKAPTEPPAPARAGQQCNLDACSARYKTFNAADCTYEPYGGGPRRTCELSSVPSAEPPRAAADAGAEAKDTWVAPSAAEARKAITPARAGEQCNVEGCAARYSSFHASDCSYQPHSGGPRQTCELRSSRSAELPRRAAPDAGSEAKAKETSVEDKETTVEEGSSEAPDSDMPARAGRQCNVQLCAARYSSFHASDCTYQPLGGGPRQTCER